MLILVGFFKSRDSKHVKEFQSFGQYCDRTKKHQRSKVPTSDKSAYLNIRPMNGSEIVAFLIILCINVFFLVLQSKKIALKKSVYLDFSLMCLSPLNE